MIAKITKGKRASGAIRYDFGPGRRDEHENARVLAGSVPGTPQQIARIIDHHTRPSGLTSPIWRCSLSLPDEDGILSDAKFAEIARQYVERMGYGACPWVAVRHGDDHIHLTVSRVGWDRRTVPDRQDYVRSMPIVRALEQEHGLVDAGALSDRTAPQVSGQERAASQRRGAVEPERLTIRAAVWAARDSATGRGRAHFEQLLTGAGVDFKANVAPSTGRMNGYAFSLPSWVDADGAQVWVTASKTARDLAWQKLGPVLEPPAEEQPAVPEPAPVLTADLARQKLAEARDRVADRRAQLADQLRTIPAGTVADVPAALRTARHTLTTREAKLAAESATAMRLDGIASGVSRGPRRAELHRRRAALEDAVAIEAQAAAYSAAAAEQRQTAAAARHVEQESTAKAGRRWSRSATRTGAEGMATAAAELLARAETEAKRLDALATAALDVAGETAPEGVSPPYAQALAALDTRWRVEEANAGRDDARDARVQHIDHSGYLQAARVAVGQARRDIELLDAEQLRRAALAPEHLVAEDRIRADLVQAERAAVARGRSTTSSTRRSTPKAGPGKPPPSQPGPRPQQPRREPPTHGR